MLESSNPQALQRTTTPRMPAVYEAAKEQLAKCARIDECQDWADKAAALISYARQSEDEELEKLARRIRLRALTRIGEILKEIEPQRGGDRKSKGRGRPVDRKTAAETAGLSERQRKTSLRLASVPKHKREALIESPNPPTVGQLAKKGTKTKAKPLVDLKGRDPVEFEASTRAQGYVELLVKTATDVAPAVAVRGSFDHERAALLENARTLALWINQLIKILEDKK